MRPLGEHNAAQRASEVGKCSTSLLSKLCKKPARSSPEASIKLK
jgi:hypothetical protein